MKKTKTQTYMFILTKELLRFLTSIDGVYDVVGIELVKELEEENKHLQIRKVTIQLRDEYKPTCK